jgi:hypothetical protein
VPDAPELTQWAVGQAVLARIAAELLSISEAVTVPCF